MLGTVLWEVIKVVKVSKTPPVSFKSSYSSEELLKVHHPLKLLQDMDFEIRSDSPDWLCGL